jgi:transcriptional regulator with XRE-family HTH domain
MSFGRVIVDARRRKGLSQKALAARIQKEDGTPISPQYLNDLERDRRNPPSEHLLQQFAAQLDLDPEYVCFVAGAYPADLRATPGATPEPERVVAAFRAFRRALNGQ